MPLKESYLSLRMQEERCCGVVFSWLLSDALGETESEGDALRGISLEDPTLSPGVPTWQGMGEASFMSSDGITEQWMKRGTVCIASLRCCYEYVHFKRGCQTPKPFLARRWLFWRGTSSLGFVRAFTRTSLRSSSLHFDTGGRS